MSRIRAWVSRALLRVLHRTLPEGLYKFHGLILYLPRGVFNPLLTLSTSLILDVLDKLKPEGQILDYGCGSGIIAIYAAKSFEGVRKVIGIDVNPLTVATARVNARLNSVEEKTLFLPSSKTLIEYPVGLVVSNPPYLPLKRLDTLDLNWCAGEDLMVIREVIITSSRILRSGGGLLITYSSLTGPNRVESLLVENGFKIKDRWDKPTPLDTVFVAYAEKT